MSNVTTPHHKGDTREDRIVRALEEFRASADAGSPISRDQLLQHYPDIAEELASCLDNLDFIDHVAPQLGDNENFNAPHSEPGIRALTTLGDFRIMREIGRGGMGVVYQAEQLSLGRKVALKVLPFAGMLDKRQLSRFQNEARAAATLKHANIVSVHFVGSDRGVHFYAMELIEGLSMAQFISALRTSSRPYDLSVTPGDDTIGTSFPMTLPQSELDTAAVATLSTDYSKSRNRFFLRVAELGIDAATALDHAHERGIIHRDVKPGNLLIDHGGKLLVTDFGLARIEADKSMTVSGDLLGTLRYMSPEQALAKRVIVDHHTDVYSLGVTLYELATLRPAFDGSDRQELLRKIVFENPPPLRRIDPSIPRDLETIILKAIAKDPAARYDTASELAEDLRRFTETRPIVARRQGVTSKAIHWARRNRKLTASISVGLVLLSTLAVGGPIVAYRQMQTNREVVQLNSRLQDITYQQEMGMYGRDMQLANKHIDEGRYLEAEHLLLKWVRNRAKTDQRGFEWYYLWRRCHDPAIEQTIAHELAVYDVEFVGSSSRLAVAWLASDVAIWDLPLKSTAEPVQKLPSQTVAVTAVYQIPDAAELLSGDEDGGIDIWNTDSGKQLAHCRLETPSDENRVNTLDVSPDGQFIAAGVGTTEFGHVHVWSREKEEWIVKLDQLEGDGLAAFGPRGRLIVASGRSGRLRIFELEDASMVAEHDIDAQEINMIEVSPDRSLLALGAFTRYGAHGVGRIEIWDTTTWERKASIPMERATPRSFAFTSDNSLLAIGDSAGRIFLVETSGSQVITTIQAHAFDVNGLAFSPDNSRLASASSDERVHVWRVEKLRNRLEDPSLTQMRLEEGYTTGATFLHRGETAAYSDTLGNVHLLNVETGQLEDQGFHVEQPGANVVQITPSPDGTLLAVSRGYFPPQRKALGKLAFIDVATGEEHSAYELLGLIYSLSSFSPDGRYFAIARADRLVVIDVFEKRVEKELEFDSSVRAPTFSPDGRWLACCTSDGMTHFTHAGDFSESHSIRTDSKTTECIDFSPDGRVVAAVGVDAQVKLYAVETGNLLRAFKQTPSFTPYVRFSPDGQRLVSASTDGIARIWHVESGEELLALQFPPTSAYFPAVEFSDGRTLLATAGKHAQVYRGADPDELAQLTVAELNDLVCQHMAEIFQTPTDLELPNRTKSSNRPAINENQTHE